MEIKKHNSQPAALLPAGRAVDDLHPEGSPISGGEPASLHRGATRRRFLRDAGTGLALVIGSTVVTLGALPSTASAAAALTDQDLAMFAESVELALAGVYALALQTGKVTTPSNMTLLTTIGSHHSAHAQMLGAFAGDAATAQPNPGVAAAVDDEIREAPDETHILSVAFDTENAAAATYLYVIGLLNNVQILDAAASILPVEAEHAAALGYILGRDPDTDPDYMPPFQTTDDELTPATYPAAK